MALLNREKQAIVQQLPIGEISPSPHQTRRDFHEEELAALAQSIDRSGLLNPISVRALPQGGYCLIAGERRWRACQMLGWQRIPALVWQKEEPDAAALTLAENLHRSDLHYMEEAESLSDRIGIMRDGTLLAVGTAEELKQKSGADKFEDAFVAIVKG